MGIRAGLSLIRLTVCKDVSGSRPREYRGRI